MPYTNHLNAIIAMVTSKKDFAVPMQPDHVMFLSVLGHLDLQTHTLNRMTPQKYIWHTYCRGQLGVHGTSGLPYSLMDLLSSMHIPGTDIALMAWTAPLGEPAQQCLWKATRFAGMLSAYHVQRLLQPTGSVANTASASRTFKPGVLVNSILALLHQCLVFVASEPTSFKQTLIYPLVMAASQRHILDIASKAFICETIEQLASERNHFLYRGILRVVRDFWRSGDESLEDTAKRMDIELCLL